ncbi:hypothetical protein V495_02953 [Pseudogymnoascus sp. VKM F-4514 (FW-929)]|nr:hypothetical protein V495_02953 [Pseudogymnoascus sp. VKM F-4514 (FW-929)]
MRAAPQGETWEIEAVLPAAHTRAVYSVAWSEKTGRVVSCGGDSKIVVYGEVGEAKADTEGEKGEEGEKKEGEKAQKGPGKWQILATTEMGHGPYEINPRRGRRERRGRRRRGRKPRKGQENGKSSPRQRWAMGRMRLTM